MAEGHAALDAIGAPGLAHTHLVAFEAIYFPGSPTAREAAEVALANARQVGNPTNLAVAFFAVACANQDSDPDRALAAAEENLAVIGSGAGDGSFYVTASLAAVLYARRADAPASLAALGDVARWARDNAHPGATLMAISTGVEVMAELARFE